MSQGIHTEKSSMTPAKILNSVARSFVAMQKYKSIEEAIHELAISAVRNKISYYRRRIRKFERKYSEDFDTFTNHLKGGASLSEEDDWFEWRSALSMIKDWKIVYEEINDNKEHFETAKAALPINPKFQNCSL